MSQEYFRQVISKRRRGVVPSLLRGIASLIEPFYALTTLTRNRLYDGHWLRAHRAARPVVCVGNITTGGTGKTPVVRWLADQFRRCGHHPAILMRGYKSSRQHRSDEQRLLELLLESSALPATASIAVVADPDRLNGARLALGIDANIDVFLLDDGFQHRRLARDFDLLLIDANNPFGYGRLLPRGMLRESLRGLRRASAFLITKIQGSSPDQLIDIERTIRQYNPWTPLYHCQYVHSAVTSAAGETIGRDLLNRRLFIFAGIGNPQVFEQQLRSSGGECVGRRWLDDHHHYTEMDVAALERQARACRADLMLTTEKDWIKLQSIESSRRTSPPIARVQLDIQFIDDDEHALLHQIKSVIGMMPDHAPARRLPVSQARELPAGNADDV